MLAVALVLLAVLAGTMSYAGYLLIGVLADHLGTGRFLAGLLLGVLFARFPRMREGKLRVVGLLPKAVRRPLIVSLFALCALYFLAQGDYLPAVFTGFATAFLLAFPWLRQAVFGRISSFGLNVPGQNPRKQVDDMVIDGEFREKKD